MAAQPVRSAWAVEAREVHAPCGEDLGEEAVAALGECDHERVHEEWAVS